LFKEDIKKAEQIGSLRFTINGNIISELGEESISNPSIAISELLKNSYDANAENVDLIFSNIEKNDTKIAISDDGDGMDYSELKEKWMDIGSPHKKEIKTSGRVLVGAKGIGRFASHCLGNNLKLITGSKNEHYGYRLFFDWKKFDPKIKVTDVDVCTEKFEKKVSSKGTTLIISDLKKNWNDNESLRCLLKDIYLLTHPISPPKKFKIKENISKKIKLNKLNKTFLDRAAYHLKIKLSKKKELTFEFYKNNILVKKDKEELKENLNCGDTCFDFFFYYKSARSWKDNLNKKITKKELEEISDMLDIYGGIKLYRDKFRVKPYGDKDADWIGLDKWSRDNSFVPGNTQSIGFVSITKLLNSKIVDTTTREGVIATIEYFDIVRFITTSIKKFVELRKEVESHKAKARKTKIIKKKKIEVLEPKAQEPITVSETPFIRVSGNFPNSHYDQIIYEINECESRNLPNAAFWLCRKIVENFVFHILEKKFPKRVEFWYDCSNNRNLSFSRLIETLYENRGYFRVDVQNYIVQFKTDVGKFKRDVDAAIHRNYVYLSDKSELQQYKINKILQLLFDIYSRA